MKPSERDHHLWKKTVSSFHLCLFKMSNQGGQDESRADNPEGRKPAVDDVYSFEDDPVVGRFNSFGTEMSAMVSALTQVVSARSLTSSTVDTHSSSSSAGLKRERLGNNRVDSSLGPIGG